MTVAPGTAASAASVALVAESPVSRVSPGPLGIVAGSRMPAGGCPLGACPLGGCPLGAWAYPEGAVVELDPEPAPVAAPASPAAPTASPVATAAVTIHERLLRAGV